MEEAFDPDTVRGIRVLVACDWCKEKGSVPGGQYKSQGEVVPCPICGGHRVEEKTISLAMLKALLENEEMP